MRLDQIGDHDLNDTLVSSKKYNLDNMALSPVQCLALHIIYSDYILQKIPEVHNSNKK